MYNECDEEKLHGITPLESTYLVSVDSFPFNGRQRDFILDMDGQRKYTRRDIQYDILC